jgi:hypothetical protein
MARFKSGTNGHRIGDRSDDFGLLPKLAYSNVGRSSGIGPFDRCLSLALNDRIFDLSPTDLTI